MSNISFTNPYLLFIGLGLIVVVVVSFFVLIKKQGFNFHSITSLILHIAICILVALALAQMTYRKVITETDVYVLADCSYSSNNNLDKIDDYIKDLNKNLPKNSKVGIICYGKDYELLVKPGESIKSVKEANVDNSETNIKPALAYAATLFDESAIKRIVIISDGRETDESSMTGLINDYQNQNIHIDAIFLDNNISEEQKEIQISNVEFDKTTYKNEETLANVTVEANQNVDIATLKLFKNNEEVDSQTIKLTKGTNTFNFKLDTETSGEFDYKVELSEFSSNDFNDVNDTNKYNNQYLFKQIVSENVRVLFISNTIKINDNESYNDKTKFEEMYSSDDYDITYYEDTNDVPYSIEDLCKFDEIVLSNVDVRELNHSENFVSNLDLVVSEYGKSLVTIGNTYIQNKSDSTTEAQKEVLSDLSSMLPIKYDSNDDDRRLFTIVFDASKSIDSASMFQVAKQVASSTVDFLTEKDDLYIVGFYGNAFTIFQIDSVTDANKVKAKEYISNVKSRQATSLGAALKFTYEQIQNLVYAKKEILLISDGLAYNGDNDKINETLASLVDINAHVSAFYIGKRVSDETSEGGLLMKQIASKGNGNYYFAYSSDTASQTLKSVSDDVKEVHKESTKGYPVTILKPKHSLVNGLTTIESINDFYSGNAKTTATTVLEVSENNTRYPLYSTWKYGEGNVSCISTNLRYWSNETNGYKLANNIVSNNTPSSQNYVPYVFEITSDGSYTNVSVITTNLNVDAIVVLNITYPSGNLLKKTMSFNSTNYITSFKADEAGIYKLDLTYTLGDMVESTTEYTSLSYLPEYNSFEFFDSSNLYGMITNDGNVSEDGKLTISNDGLQMTTYKYEFALVLMVIACALYVVDIAIRKLRWQDIKDLFRKKKKVNA